MSPAAAIFEAFSTLTCPECGHQSTDRMPVNACRYYYDCENCHAMLKPKRGDCCVYCSYGSVRCPPVQLGGTCSSTES